MKSNHFSLGLSILLFIIQTTSYAQSTITWTGGGSGWNDPANWSSDPSLPSNGDQIIIDGNVASPATVDAASGFTGGHVDIINGGELIINNTFDVFGERITTITGPGSRLTVNTGGLFTAEFITVTDDGAIKIAGGELDVNDQLSITDGTFDMSGGLLDYNGGSGEELLLTNSTFTMTGGTLEFDRSIVVSGGTFTLDEGAIMTATSAARNLEFLDATADLAGTVNNADGDLSLFGTSVVNLLSTLSMDLDDLVMNDDGASSTLNIYGTLVAFDDLKFDESPPDDFTGDSDQIIVKDGGSLTINDSFRDADIAEAGNNIHAESGATVSIGELDGLTPEEAYGSLLTSETGAVMTVGGGDPLPVDLIYFEAKSNQTMISLQWATASEINNEYFEIMRSENDKDFNTIAKVAGNGNTNTVIEYAYSDRDLISGTYFYRLKQVDFNGNFELLPIKRVTHSVVGSGKLSVFPNPIVTSTFTLTSDNPIQNPIVEIYSLSGLLILSKELVSNKKSWIVNLSGTNVPHGSYFLKLKDQNDQNIDTIKIFVLD